MSHSAIPDAYSGVMKTIHWTTAAVIIALLLIGWTMTGVEALPGPTRGALYGLHKSLGVLVLLLTLFRLPWRLAHRTPELPPTLRPWEIRLVGLVHRLFYVLLMAQPVVGWMLYSISTHKSLFFGLFRIPDLPFLARFAGNAAVVDALEGLHGTLAALLAVLIGLHVAAAVKHHFLARDDVLLHMTPALFAPLLRRLRGQP